MYSCTVSGIIMGGLDLDKLYDNYNILSDAKEKVSEVSIKQLEISALHAYVFAAYKRISRGD